MVWVVPDAETVGSCPPRLEYFHPGLVPFAIEGIPVVFVDGSVTHNHVALRGAWGSG